MILNLLRQKNSPITLSSIAKKLRSFNDEQRFNYLYDNTFRFRGVNKQRGIELFRRYNEVTESDLHQTKAVYGVIDNIGFGTINNKNNAQKTFSSIWLNFTPKLSDYGISIDNEHLDAFLKENKLENSSEDEIRQRLE